MPSLTTQIVGFKHFHYFWIVAFALLFPSFVHAAAGTEAASFLDIPVGAEAAAMGGAYSALAADAYAPVYNPGGLGFAPATELAAQHLDYLESIHYEFLSFVHPLQEGKAVAASAQYMGSGDMTQTTDSGQKIGSFSSHFASYALAYGQKLTDIISLGIAAKWINAQISNVGANAFAADAGVLVRPSERLSLAGTMSNAGTKLTFLNDGGSLPLSGRLGAAYALTHDLHVSADGVYQAYGLASAHFGAEWRPIPMIALRAGYRTDTTPELGAIAGVTAGVGLNIWGQEFSYAWLPMGDLGMTQYFSMVLRFGKSQSEERNLIHYSHIRAVHLVDVHLKSGQRTASEYIKPSDVEYQQIMELLSDEDQSYYSAKSTAPGDTQ